MKVIKEEKRLFHRGKRGMEDSIKDMFVNIKSAKILVSLSDPSKDNYASEISSNVDCTYSHAVRILQKFEDRDLVESKKDGRKKILELTSEGEEVARDMGDLIHTIDEVSR